MTYHVRPNMLNKHTSAHLHICSTQILKHSSKPCITEEHFEPLILLSISSQPQTNEFSLEMALFPCGAVSPSLALCRSLQLYLAAAGIKKHIVIEPIYIPAHSPLTAAFSPNISPSQNFLPQVMVVTKLVPDWSGRAADTGSGQFTVSTCG